MGVVEIQPANFCVFGGKDDLVIGHIYTKTVLGMTCTSSSHRCRSGNPTALMGTIVCS